jgi:hypothetical protein
VKIMSIPILMYFEVFLRMTISGHLRKIQDIFPFSDTLTRLMHLHRVAVAKINVVQNSELRECQFYFYLINTTCHSLY